MKNSLFIKIILLGLFFNTDLISQPQSDLGKQIKSKKFKTVYLNKSPNTTLLNYNLSWYAFDALHPGFSIGMDYPLRHRTKLIQRRRLLTLLQLSKPNNIKRIDYLTYAGVKFIYSHKKNWGNLFMLQPSINVRRTGKKGAFWEGKLGLGLGRIDYSGFTFEYTGSEFKKVPLAGTWTFPLLTQINAGYDFSKKHSMPLTIFGGLGVNLHMGIPQGKSFVFTELGISYKFQNFIPKLTQKKK